MAGFFKRLFGSEGDENPDRSANRSEEQTQKPRLDETSTNVPTSPASPAETFSRVRKISSESFASAKERAEAVRRAEADVAAEWSEGDIILDHYEVQGVLGEGGMGRVYDVLHREWNKRLAVKSPQPDYFKTEKQKEDFVREAEAWIDLGLHPHTVSCFYVRTLGGIPRVFAECIEGGDLKTWIDDGRLYEGDRDEALKRILDIAIQIAGGLVFAHEKGLIHQDVKPANIMLTPEGVAKVTDFGLARARAQTGETNIDDGRSILVSCGGMTPAFCSPEQAEGRPLTHRTDIWSWAVTVLQMFIGQVAWRSGTDALEVLKRYRSKDQRIASAPQMPEALADLLARCFEHNEADRPIDFDEVVNQLQEIYKEVAKEDYPRQPPCAIDLQADALNNRGVSFWDLGRMEQTEEAFIAALVLDPHHVRATYNLGLLRWRDGRSTDTEILTQLEEIRSTRPDDWEVAYTIGHVHLERLDAENAEDNLEAAKRLGGGKVVTVDLERAREFIPHSPRCQRMFEENDKPVSSLLYSPDGLYLLTGSNEHRNPRLWEVSTGRCVRTFVGHNGFINDVDFSPDGRLCISGSNDGMAKIWDLATGRCLHTLNGQGNHINAVAYSHDGELCITGSGHKGTDGTIQLWDVATGRHVQSFEDESKMYTSLKFTLDGDYIISGSTDGLLRLWSLSTGQCVRVFEGHDSCVSSVAISPTGDYCLSGSDDKTLRLWEISTGLCIRKFVGHSNDVESIAFSMDGIFCISGSHDYTVRLWEIATGRCIRTFAGHDSFVDCVAFSPKDYHFISGSFDKTIRLWDLSIYCDKQLQGPLVLSDINDYDESDRIRRDFTAWLGMVRESHRAGDHAHALECLHEARTLPGMELADDALDWNQIIGIHCKRTGFSRAWLKRSIEGQSESITSISITKDGRFCLSGSWDCSLRIWDLRTGECTKNITDSSSKGILSVAFSPEDNLFLSAGYDGVVKLWDATSMQCVQIMEGHAGAVGSVVFSPDGRFALSGSDDNSIRLWDVATGNCLRTIEEHEGWVTSVTFRPDGLIYISGSSDGSVKLWDFVTGMCIRTCEDDTSGVHAATLSNDGNLCLSANGSEMRLWDVSTGKCLQLYEGHSDDINEAAFSHDGGYCISASGFGNVDDNTLRLWCLSTNRCVRVFKGHEHYVKSVAFTPDGRYCVSGSEDGTIKVWELDWQYEFPGWADWDEGVLLYLETFLTLHCPRDDKGFPCEGAPVWTEEDFQKLLIDLQHRGFGWLRKEGVRRKLMQMAGQWTRPPKL